MTGTKPSPPSDLPIGPGAARALQRVIEVATALTPAPNMIPQLECGSCKGTGWVDDEGWSRDYWDIPQERVPRNGLIQCGICLGTGEIDADLVPVGTQHRIRIKEPTAQWSEWRDGAAGLTVKTLKYLDVQERTIFAYAEASPAPAPIVGGVNPVAIEALHLHLAYEATPSDRGGKDGPKGKAWSAFVTARDAALAAATEGSTDA